MKRGAQLKNRDLLHGAIFVGRAEIVKYLVEQGLDPNELDESGRTPLDCGLYSGGAACEFLQKHGGRSTV